MKLFASLAVISAVMMCAVGCTREDLDRNHRKLVKSLHGTEPAVKELERDVKKGYEKTDKAVTQELEKGRDEIKKAAREVK